MIHIYPYFGRFAQSKWILYILSGAPPPNSHSQDHHCVYINLYKPAWVLMGVVASPIYSGTVSFQADETFDHIPNGPMILGSKISQPK